MVGDAGAVLVAELDQRTPGGATLTRRQARAVDRELLKVDILAAGEGIVEQDGRRAHMHPGDLVLMDLARPARWRMSAGGRWVAVVFAPAMLPIARDHLRRLTAVRLPRGDGRLHSRPRSGASFRATWTTPAPSARGSGPPRSTC